MIRTSTCDLVVRYAVPKDAQAQTRWKRNQPQSGTKASHFKVNPAFSCARKMSVGPVVEATSRILAHYVRSTEEGSDAHACKSRLRSTSRCSSLCRVRREVQRKKEEKKQLVQDTGVSERFEQHGLTTRSLDKHTVIGLVSAKPAASLGHQEFGQTKRKESPNSLPKTSSKSARPK